MHEIYQTLGWAKIITKKKQKANLPNASEKKKTKDLQILQGVTREPNGF